MIAQLVSAEDRRVVATGHTLADSTYFLPVPSADDYYVHLIESEGDAPLQGVYGGVDNPIILHIDEQTITANINIDELVEDLPLYQTIEEPYMLAEVEVFPYRLSKSIFWQQDYLLGEDEDGVRIVGFTNYSQEAAQTSYAEETCWLLPNDPQPETSGHRLPEDDLTTLPFATVTRMEAGLFIVDYYDTDESLSPAAVELNRFKSRRIQRLESFIHYQVGGSYCWRRGLHALYKGNEWQVISV
jgi:hypothetical protein